MPKEKAILCWSGGKDSSLCLLRAQKQYEIVSLLTTVNREYGRVSMHGVREELLDAQCFSLGLPLCKVYLESSCCNSDYEEAMKKNLLTFKAQGVRKVLFGDIFLQDLREYRQRQLARIGMEGVFPLWMESTAELVEEFIAAGFMSITCCVSDAWLDSEMVGRIIDREFLRSLPQEVDPCGEHGEFHSFTFDGPIFRRPIEFTVGEKVYRPIENPQETCSSDRSHPAAWRSAKGHWYCDLEFRQSVPSTSDVAS